MIKFIEKIKVLLNPKLKLQLFLLFFGGFIASLLEVIGVGSIPAFVILLTKKEEVLQYIPFENLKTFIAVTDFTSLIILSSCLLVGIFLIKNFYLLGLEYANAKVRLNLYTLNKTKLFMGYVNSPYELHLLRNPAILARNLWYDVEGACNAVNDVFLIGRDLITVILITLLLIATSPSVTILVTFFLLPVGFIFYFSVRKTLLKKGEQLQKNLGKKMLTINQTFGAIKEAKILGCENFLFNTFEKTLREIKSGTTYQSIVNAIPRLLTEIMALIVMLVILLIFVLSGKSISDMLPTLTLVAIAIAKITPFANNLTKNFTNLTYARPCVDIIAEEYKEIAKNSEIKLLKSNSKKRPLTKSEMNIELKNIYFSYPKTEKNILNNISLKINHGETIGLLGDSGAGKSTLVDIILGLLIPTKGTIKINGEDVADKLSHFNNNKGYVPQSPYIIDDTIRRNIAFGKADHEIDDEKIMNVLKVCELHLMLKDMNLGLDTNLGNVGTRISGGQRQRIAIARALYFDPDFLVMDEATNAIDYNTEKNIFKNIKQLRPNRTLIIISHRFNPSVNLDRIIIIKKGNIHDQGSFEKLSEKNKLLYFEEENNKSS